MEDHASSIVQTEDLGLSRRVERCRDFGTPYVLLHDRLFTRSGLVVAPDGSQGVSLNSKECRALLDALGGAMVQWTDGFRPANEPSEWYSVICRKFRPLDALPAKRRSEVRRGLRNCEVKRISAEELAEVGYPVYCDATKSYGDHVPVASEDVFRKGVLREVAYPDLLHNWGVYVNGRLITYAQNQIRGKVEVSYSSIKLDPASLHLYPSYALIHTMNEYYLDFMNFDYVNDGTRSIYHETNIQEFLIHKFYFEKAYTTLHIYYRWPLRWFVNMAYPFREYVGQADSRLRALLELERFRRASRLFVGDAQ